MSDCPGNDSDEVVKAETRAKCSAINSDGLTCHRTSIVIAKQERNKHSNLIAKPSIGENVALGRFINDTILL
jgi:hypothetical protein